MTTMTKRAQGTFCWPELGTTDQDAAKKFYTAMFGWTSNDIPMPEEMGGGYYAIFQLGGRDVAAMYRLMPDMVKNGVPPNWGAYIAVDNVDTVAKKAKELGGRVTLEPMDVMGTHGRMAALMDPTGAAFSVWQAGTHSGAQALDENGALVWTELMTPDAAKAGAFYTALIGYKTQTMPMPQGGDYTMFQDPADAKSRGGMMQIRPDMGPVPPHWLSYFGVADITKSLAQAKSLGATVVMDVTPVPQMGQFAILCDPQGAAFALFQSNAK